MKNSIFLIIAILLSVTAFAQHSDTPKKAKFFIDEREADILVAKLIDAKNFSSIGVAGVSPGDMTKKTTTKKPTSLSVSLKPDSKFMNLPQFFARYKVPEANQQMIKVNGELLVKKENFVANESRIAKVELGKDASVAFVNIKVK